MKKHFVGIAVGVLLTMVISACGAGGAGAPNPATGSGEAPIATTARAGGSAAATLAPAGKGSTAADSDSLSLSSRAAGLDKLKSYRARWQSQWSSTDAGKTTTTSWDWTEEYSATPVESLHLIWKGTDSSNPSGNQNMEMYQIGTTSYIVTTDADGKTSCMSMSSDDPSSGLTKGIFSPNSLGSVSNAKLVGTENVNGVQAKHYKYDDKSVALVGSGQVTGEMWVAVDGGYVVKDVVSWTGGAGIMGLGTGANGKGNWTWELSDANKTVTIKAPENCGGAATGLPVMKDATGKSTFGDTLMYTSPSKMADVVAFYQKEMPAAGWKLDGDPDISADYATMDYIKGTLKASIMLSTSSGKVEVYITVAEQ